MQSCNHGTPQSLIGREPCWKCCFSLWHSKWVTQEFLRNCCEARSFRVPQSLLFWHIHPIWSCWQFSDWCCQAQAEESPGRDASAITGEFVDARNLKTGSRSKMAGAQIQRAIMYLSIWKHTENSTLSRFFAYWHMTMSVHARVHKMSAHFAG